MIKIFSKVNIIYEQIKILINYAININYYNKLYGYYQFLP